MADIIVSQSLASSSPLDQDATKAIGIDLPIGKSNTTGYFKQTYTTADAVKVDLINLLLTRVGERPMNPSFGSRLYYALFEQQTDELDDAVDDTIREAISEWMPFVDVHDVEIKRETDPSNIYKMKIEIRYSVPNVVSFTTVSLLVE